MSSDLDRRRSSADTSRSSADSHLGTAGNSALAAGALPRTTHDLIVPVPHPPRAAPMVGADAAIAGTGPHAQRTPVAADELSSSLGRAFGPITHAAPAPRIADRGNARLNAVLKVVAYDEHGSLIRSWGAKARWEGSLPQHFHGDRAAGRWRWDNLASAHAVRVNTRADGTGGELVEAWAGKLHTTRIEIFAEPIDAVTERPAVRPRDAHDPHAPGHAEDADAAGARSSARLRQPGHGPDEIDHPVPDHPTPGPRVRGEHALNDGGTTAEPWLGWCGHNIRRGNQARRPARRRHCVRSTQ